METPFITFLCLLVGIYPVESVTLVTGYVGESAVIRCRYDRQYKGYSKYLCRGKCIWGSKDIPVQTDGGQTKAINGRFSLHDDTTSRVFTVTITGLTADDSGQYWCGITTGFGKTDVYTELDLNVIKDRPPSSTSTIPSSADDPTLSTPPSSLSSTSFSPQTSNTDHVLETTTTGQSTVDQGDSVLIVSAVVVLFIVTGGWSALYYRQRRNKQSADCGPFSLHNKECVDKPHVYETTGDLGNVPESGVSGSSLYYLAGPHDQPSLRSTVNTVRRTPEQPIYCNSQDIVIYSIFSLPEGSPTMHYSTITVSQLSPGVSASATLGHNAEGENIYSEIQQRNS